MGVYIKGISKPKTCAYCPAGFCVNVMERGIINTLDELHKRRHSETIPDDCPYVEIPPHGDLIDRDALEKEAQKRLQICGKNDNQFQKPYEIMRAIALAPTIIEAEEAQE